MPHASPAQNAARIANPLEESQMAASSHGVLQGTLELLVLKTLAAAGELHGFAILDFIRGATEERLLIEEGALYPALHRMEERGWLASEWATSEKGRKAKYYHLTRKGVTALEREQARWAEYVELVAKIAPRS